MQQKEVDGVDELKLCMFEVWRGLEQSVISDRIHEWN